MDVERFTGHGWEDFHPRVAQGRNARYCYAFFFFSRSCEKVYASVPVRMRIPLFLCPSWDGIDGWMFSCGVRGRVVGSIDMAALECDFDLQIRRWIRDVSKHCLWGLRYETEWSSGCDRSSSLRHARFLRCYRISRWQCSFISLFQLFYCLVLDQNDVEHSTETKYTPDLKPTGGITVKSIPLGDTGLSLALQPSQPPQIERREKGSRIEYLSLISARQVVPAQLAKEKRHSL